MSNALQIISDIPPIYVYLSKPRNGLPQNGHDYHPAPDTTDITGVSGLLEAKPKTPKQNGGGKRERWIDAKGRRVYEWDSQLNLIVQAMVSILGR